jgi:hypothetical protein
MKLANYPASKDYEYLAELMLSNLVICIVTGIVSGRKNIGIASAVKSKSGKTINGNCFLIEVNDSDFIASWDKEDFIKKCKECNLEFIVPCE